MLTSQTLERINALGLDLITETAVIEIIEDAVAVAASHPANLLPSMIPGDWPPDYLDQFWAIYPNKKAKGAALKALDKIAHAGKVRWVHLMAGLERYNMSQDVKKGYVMKPLKWLNGECWSDEDGPKPKNDRPLSFFEIAAGHR